MNIKKVLLFWLWPQWQKYLKYFLKNNYFIDWVCKTEKTRQYIEKNYFIKIFLENENFNIFDYDLIIFALPPKIQWEKVLEILEKWFSKKIIVEIPVSFDNQIINKIKKYNNVFFFLEEYFTKLWYFLRKINCDKIEKIKINIFTNKQDYENIFAREVTFLHIKSNFLWLNLAENIFEYEVNYHDLEDIFYEVNFFYNNLEIFYSFKEKKILKISEKIYNDDFCFDNILEKYLHLEGNFNYFYKLNFL